MSSDPTPAAPPAPKAEPARNTTRGPIAQSKG